MKTLWQADRAGIETHLNRCCHTVHQRSTCTRCVDACPTGALVFDDGLKLDMTRCRECGTCTVACPTSALEARNPTDDQLLNEMHRAIQAKRPVILACAPMTPANLARYVISVPCLARLDEGTLLAGLALGAPRVHLLDAECSQCPFADARTTAERVVDRVNALLQEGTMAGGVRFIESIPQEWLTASPVEAAPGPSRRDFFRLMMREAGRLGSESVYQRLGGDVGTAETSDAGRIPARRDILLKAWRKLQSVATTARYDSTGLWAHVKVADTCDLCQMCALFCPTGALVKADSAGMRGLAFTAARCLDCGLCADACHRQAIEYDHSGAAADLLDGPAVLLREAPDQNISFSAIRETRLADAVRQTLGL